MLPPLIRRARKNDAALAARQRGFTMAFVAITMVAIISMAALSIDIGTLYEAKAEAQRAADAAALAAAQVISTSGLLQAIPRMAQLTEVGPMFVGGRILTAL